MSRSNKGKIRLDLKRLERQQEKLHIRIEREIKELAQIEKFIADAKKVLEEV